MKGITPSVVTGTLLFFAQFQPFPLQQLPGLITFYRGRTIIGAVGLNAIIIRALAVVLRAV
jgi:hypothetical protein